MNKNFFFSPPPMKRMLNFLPLLNNNSSEWGKKIGKQEKSQKSITSFVPSFFVCMCINSVVKMPIERKNSALKTWWIIISMDLIFISTLKSMQYTRDCVEKNDCAKNETIVKLCYSDKTNIELPFIWWKLCAEQKKIYNNVAIIVLRDSIHTNC